MANWKYRCNILQHVRNEDLSTSEQVERIAQEISSCRGFDDTLFAEYLTELLDLEDDDLEREANAVLSSVYDYADANLIWTGG